MKIDFSKVYEKAEAYKPAISRFLRDMIAIPSESRQEAKVIQRVKEEMETVGFDRVDIDPMGNILGYIGNGRHLIAMDAHVDTVGVGDPDQWEYDPYKGYEDDEIIVVAEVPGVERDEIKVRIKGTSLTIHADNPERPYHKVIELPSKVKKNEAKSAIRNGVLEVRLKKA